MRRYDEDLKTASSKADSAIIGFCLLVAAMAAVASWIWRSSFIGFFPLPMTSFVFAMAAFFRWMAPKDYWEAQDRRNGGKVNLSPNVVFNFFLEKEAREKEKDAWPPAGALSRVRPPGSPTVGEASISVAERPIEPTHLMALEKERREEVVQVSS